MSHIYIALMQSNTVKPHAPEVYILYQIGYVMGYMQWCLHAYIYTRVSLYACHIFRDEANMLAVCTINKNLIYSPEHTTTHIEMGTKMSNTAALPIAIPRCNCTVQKNFNYIWSSHLHACISVSLKRILCTSQDQSSNYFPRPA